MEKHIDSFDKNFRSKMRGSEEENYSKTEEKKGKWWKENIFSPARDLQNSVGNTKNHRHRPPHQHSSVLKFHPYVRDRAQGVDMFRHFFPFIPQNLLAMPGSQSQTGPTSDSQHPINNSSFPSSNDAKANNTAKTIEVKQNSFEKDKEMEEKTNKTEKKQEQSNKMVHLINNDCQNQKQAKEKDTTGNCQYIDFITKTVMYATVIF